MLRSVFDSMDRSKTHTLTQSMFRDVLKRLGEEVPDDEIKTHYADVDIRKDGTIDWPTYLTLLWRIKNSKQHRLSSFASSLPPL